LFINDNKIVSENLVKNNVSIDEKKVIKLELIKKYNWENYTFFQELVINNGGGKYFIIIILKNNNKLTIIIKKQKNKFILYTIYWNK